MVSKTLFRRAEEVGFEPTRAGLTAQGISNPPQWTSYATPPNSVYSIKVLARTVMKDQLIKYNHFMPKNAWLLAYLFIPLLAANLSSGDEQQFSYLALSFLKGSTSYVTLPPTISDLSYFNNHYYLPFGPFPAIIIMPFVLLFKTNFPLGFLLLALNILNFWLVYRISIILKLETKKALFTSIFFIFGSVYTPVTALLYGAYFAQIVATSLLLLALYVFLSKKKWLIIGILLGFAMATRSNLIVASLFFISGLTKGFLNYKNVIKLFLPIIASIVLIACYNYQRFANVFERGYSYQLIPEESALRRQQGLISFRHIPANLYYMLIKTPDPILADESHVLKFPYLRFDPYGMSIFFMSPILFLIFKAKLSDHYVKASLLTTLAITTTIVTYYGIGWRQIGYRYALDFYPFLLIPLVSALKKTNMKLVKIMVLCGVVITWFFIIERFSGL